MLPLRASALTERDLCILTCQRVVEPHRELHLLRSARELTAPHQLPHPRTVVESRSRRAVAAAQRMQQSSRDEQPEQDERTAKDAAIHVVSRGHRWLRRRERWRSDMRDVTPEP
jgi:hypothetical protein